jgi:hypothetical protein
MRILIDLKSIKKNKDAGSTVTRILTNGEPAECLIKSTVGKITIEEMSEELKKLDCTVTEWSISSEIEQVGSTYEMKFLCNPTIDADHIEKLQEKIRKVGANWIGMSIHKPSIFHHHDPIPEYSYSYTEPDVMVDCDECTARFPYKERGKSWYYDDYDYGKGDENCCPFCEEEFYVERETIEEANERVKTTN